MDRLFPDAGKVFAIDPSAGSNRADLPAPTSPTPLGEGKITTAIGLAMGLCRLPSAITWSFHWTSFRSVPVIPRHSGEHQAHATRIGDAGENEARADERRQRNPVWVSKIAQQGSCQHE